MPRRFAIATVGCKTNQFESSSLARSLMNEGLIPVPFDQFADVYIVNSCTVTARADADTRKLIRQCSFRNPSATIVLTGCFAQVSPDEASKLPGVTFVVGNDEKGSIPSLISTGTSSSSEGAGEFLPLKIYTERLRATIRIQTGCDAFCSYCIVPYARGRSRSVPPETIIAAVKTLASTHREIVFTGIHIGHYGRDLDEPQTLAALLRMIEEETPQTRLRLGSIEPLEFTPELQTYLASSKSIAPHLHIPVQSGSDTVLQRMNRHYHPRDVMELFRTLKSLIPDLTIGIDLMVGFPGETESEFQETCRFLERLPFDYAHIFQYSPRRGTPAASFAHQVPPDEKRQRARTVRTIVQEKRTAWLTRWVGKTVEVLPLRTNKEGRTVGITSTYLPVIIDSAETSSFCGEIRCTVSRRENDRLVVFPTRHSSS